MFQNQFVSLFYFAVPDQAQPVDGGNMHGAVKGAGSCFFMVGPIWLAPPQFPGLDQADGAAVQARGQIAQGIAAKGLVPYFIAEFAHGHGAGEDKGTLLRRDCHEDLPFFSLGECFQKFRPADFFKKIRQAVHEPLPLFIIRRYFLDVGS